MYKGNHVFRVGSLKMCGIFAYLNHLTPKTRAEVIELLIKVEMFIQTIITVIFITFYILMQGLKRLEYRGYDSAGIGIDGPNGY